MKRRQETLIELAERRQARAAIKVASREWWHRKVPPMTYRIALFGMLCAISGTIAWRLLA